MLLAPAREESVCCLGHSTVFAEAATGGHPAFQWAVCAQGPGRPPWEDHRGALGEADCEQGWSLGAVLLRPGYVAYVQERRGVVHQGTRVS